MKIIRVALLVIILAVPVFAGEIQYGVTATGEIQNDVTATGNILNDVNVAGDIPYGITLLNLLRLILP